MKYVIIEITNENDTLEANVLASDGGCAREIRNKQMAEYADALIAVWDGSSRGTGGMISLARAHGLKVYVHHHDTAE